MRYQDKGELHLDFHGATNTTIQYIVDRFGEDALKQIFSRVGKDVYRSIHEGLQEDNREELVRHLQYYLDREGGEYTLSDTDELVVFEITKCPAVAQIKKLGFKLSPYFCHQTRDVNQAWCENTPWQSKTELLGVGHCRQTFSRRGTDDSE